MLMRTFGVAIVTLVLAVMLVNWLSAPSVTSNPELTSPRGTHDPGLPTFAQVEARLPDMAELAQAHREGRLIEDPERGDLRRAVLSTYEQYRQLPCDEILRRDFVAAVIPFIETVHNSRGAEPIEIFHGTRGVLNATKYLDGEVIQELSMAAGFGLLDHDELPPYAPQVIGPMLSQFKSGMAMMGKAYPQRDCP